MGTTESDDNVMQSILKAAESGSASGAGIPPVEQWNPDHCGQMDMVIRKDGTWWHEGTRITRERLVKLFSRVLRKDEDGKIYLVTPHEKIEIEVEAAPFLAVRVDKVERDGETVIVFTTNFDDSVALGEDHPLRIEIGEDGEPEPYVLVRGRLEALLTRPAFYELVNMAETARDNAGRMVLSVTSQGQRFELGEVDPGKVEE